MSENVQLKARQILAIEALLSNATIGAAAVAAGVEHKTLTRWMRDETFGKELAARKTELLRGAMSKLLGEQGKSIETLVELRDGQDKGLKFSAAKLLLELAVKYQERVDHEERITRLEEGGGGGGE